MQINRGWKKNFLIFFPRLHLVYVAVRFLFSSTPDLFSKTPLEVPPEVDSRKIRNRCSVNEGKLSKRMIYSFDGFKSVFVCNDCGSLASLVCETHSLLGMTGRVVFVDFHQSLGLVFFLEERLSVSDAASKLFKDLQPRCQSS
jgi:hypothetical protein